MKSAPDQNVDAYIRGFPADVQQILRALRKAIRQVVPEAEESISYGIPTYKLAKRPFVYFAGYQHHVSLYPATERSVAPLRARQIFSEGLRPSDSPTRSLARRFDGSLRSRGSVAGLPRADR